MQMAINVSTTTRATHPYQAPQIYWDSCDRFLAGIDLSDDMRAMWAHERQPLGGGPTDGLHWKWIKPFRTRIPLFYFDCRYISVWEFSYTWRIGHVPTGLIPRPACSVPQCLKFQHLRLRRQRHSGALGPGEIAAITALFAMWPLHHELDSEESIAHAYGVPRGEVRRIYLSQN